MGGQPPAALRRLVYRPPHQWVTEGEFAGRLGRAQQPAIEQLVERREGVLNRDLTNRSRELGVERITGHRSAVQQPAGGGPHLLELLSERRGDNPRNLHGGRRDCAVPLLARRVPARARELLDVERVTPALPKQRVELRLLERAARKLRRLRAVERCQIAELDQRGAKPPPQPR